MLEMSVRKKFIPKMFLIFSAAFCEFRRNILHFTIYKDFTDMLISQIQISPSLWTWSGRSRRKTGDVSVLQQTPPFTSHTSSLFNIISNISSPNY